MKEILVTGSKGQLGSEIYHSSLRSNDSRYIFTDIEELDITSAGALEKFFKENRFDFIVNCAAYTAVDKAESDAEAAMKLNSTAPGYLAKFAEKYNSRLIHISTDFVFDGYKNVPYTEEDKANPLSVYGKTKLAGEVEVAREMKDYMIIRTSWLYSEYGHNFMKSMIRYGMERDHLKVVFDQVGTPTYAKDLAEFIIQLVENKSGEFKSGIYHYSNEGVSSWFDFAQFIIKRMKINCEVVPVRTSQYPTPAVRPAYSVLDKAKIKSVFGIRIPHWEDSLERSLGRIEN